MDACLLVTHNWDNIGTEDDPELKRKAVVYAEAIPGYEWVGDSSGTLGSRFDADFKLGLTNIFERFDQKGASLSESEGVLEYTPVLTPVPPTQPSKRAASKKKADDVKAKMDAADALVAADSQKKAGEVDPRPKVSVRPDSEVLPHLSEVGNGEKILVENVTAETPNGFQLTPKGKVVQVRGARWVYEVNGDKVVSMNQLPDGIAPVPDPAVNSGFFCQITGKEVDSELATTSRIRASRILCDEEFARVVAEELL
jgi:hypothetical protein